MLKKKGEGRFMDHNRKVPAEYCEKMEGGRFEKINYDSCVYSQDRRAAKKTALVYLPKGYDEGDKRYKTLYIMHGGGGNEEEFFYCQDRSLVFKNILDHMIENGDIEPLIVVAPSFYYSDSVSALHNTFDAGILTKNYHLEFRNDLLPAIDGKYRTITDREARAFGGFSMGAEATWEMFLNALDLIKNFMPLSGDCWIVEEKGGASQPEVTAKLMAEHLKDKGLDGYSYNIYAFTGDKDIAYEAMDALVKAMPAAGFGGSEDKRLRYGVRPGGIHTYGFGYEYIYNILSEVL